MLNRVREFREARTLTLEELANSVDSSARFLCALEEGRSVATVDVALKIAHALNTTVEELFDASSPETKSTVVESVEDKTVADGVVSAEGESEPVVVKDASSETPVRKRRASRKTEETEKSVPERENASDSSEKKSLHRKKNDDKKEKADDEPAPRVDAYSPQLSVVELFTNDGMSLFSEPGRNDQNSPDSNRGRRVFAPTKSQTISSYYSRTAQAEGVASSPSDLIDPTADRPIRFFDLFCGIGGFRYAANNVFASMRREGECVLSCDVDPHAQQSYAANFGDVPFGDVEQLPSDKIPDFDLLFAGFPCQTFSIIGLRKGFADETKGSLFFQIARILRDKRPRAFVLENVRQLTTHDGGRTFEIILRVLQDELGYYVDWRVLNALDFGLPQKRERVVVVGSTEPFDMEWPKKTSRALSLADVLEPEREVPKKYYASPEIVKSRKKAHQSKYNPSVWHENKSGYVSSYPYSCALRAGASYNYLLVNGERRFTPLELLRLQGFPDDFKIVVSYTQLRKQVGNAAPVNLIERALERFLPLVFEAR